MREVTDHDRSTIAWNPRWAVLHYQSRESKIEEGFKERWYAGIEPCDSYDTNVEQCHEYPFFSTLEGGANSVPSKNPWIVPVNKTLNRRQGGKYRAFAQTCLKRTYGARFLSIPVPKGSAIPTLLLCNK